MPGQDDELQAWYHDAHVVVANAKASVDSYGNAIGETEVMEVPSFGDDVHGGGRGLGSSGVHEEVTPVVLGSAGGELVAMGLSTPPMMVGGRGCDITPPKLEASGHDSRTAAHCLLTQQAVPAFPTSC